jgi:ribosomal protein S19E (S16A)
VTLSPAKLIEVAVDPATLTDRQRQALEILARYGHMTGLELGCELDYHPDYRRTAGLKLLQALKAKGLVTERAGKRFELSPAGRRAVGKSAQTGEIPF